jgi:tetratricopeptide (TPR) repeat protein
LCILTDVPTNSSPAKWYNALGYYFQWAYSDAAGALAHYQRALALSESIGCVNKTGLLALNGLSRITSNMGNYMEAKLHAQKAHKYAEQLGDIYGQAQSLYLQARCEKIFANYQHYQVLLQQISDLLNSCGLQRGMMATGVIGDQAELHNVKTEYLESRIIQAKIASTLQPTSRYVTLTNLNIAFIDIALGVDSKLIRQQLNNCQLHLKTHQGFIQKMMSFFLETAWANLYLCEGHHTMAYSVFVRCFASFQATLYLQGSLSCLEKLADLSTGMSSIETTLEWATIFLGLALRCKDKVYTMQAFRCLGKVFTAQQDDETALSLFAVALNGFTFMDIHRWRAECMVEIADIWDRRGEVMKSAGLWKEARVLFERSSQIKDIAQINAKLEAVDSEIC